MSQERVERVDYVVIGSGFGGSVSALRLAEKGHRVLVLERGKRYRDEDFASTHVEPAPLPLGARAALLRHPPDQPLPRRVRAARLGRRRREPGLRERAHGARAGDVRRAGVAPPAGRGARCSRRTTRPRAACSASPRTRASGPPTRCCTRSRAGSGADATFRPTPVGDVLRRRRAGRGRGARSRTSAARDRRGAAASTAARAWSGAGTTRRTRSRRTTSGSPSGTARRCARSARCATSGRSPTASRTARATRWSTGAARVSRAAADASCAHAASCSPPARSARCGCCSAAAT